ncbi:hypothetical protein FRB90_003745 [Tulasnella sp. 427]|nr:hypothetical protein FRB90_003745 [Tulasnella sp. 427]
MSVISMMRSVNTGFVNAVVTDAGGVRPGVVSIIQQIRIERRQSHSNPKYKAPGCNNKNVVHRLSILREAKRLVEEKGDTFTQHDSKQFSRAQTDLVDAGVLQKASNSGHVSFAQTYQHAIDKSFKELTEEEKTDPLVIGNIVRNATEQIERKRSPSREPSVSPTKRRRTSMAPRFTTVEPEVEDEPGRPPSTRGSQAPPTVGPFKRKPKNSTAAAARITSEDVFGGSLSPPPLDHAGELRSAQAQLQQAQDDVYRLTTELERYKALLDARGNESGEHPEQSLGSIVPDSEETRTVVPSSNTVRAANLPPRSSVAYRSERRHPNRDLEEMEVSFERATETDDEEAAPAPASTRSSPVRPSVSAQGSFVLNEPSMGSSGRRTLGKTGSHRLPHPTPPHTSDEEDGEEEEEDHRDAEMDDNSFRFESVEDSYKMAVAKREEEMKRKVEELERVAEEKNQLLRDLEARLEGLQTETDKIIAEQKVTLDENAAQILELQDHLASRTEALKEAEDKHQEEILAREVAHDDMSSRTEALLAEKEKALEDVKAIRAQLDATATESAGLTVRLDLAGKRLQESEARVTELEGEARESQSALEATNTTVQTLRAQIDELQGTITEVRTQLETTQNERAQEAIASENAISQQDTEIAELKGEIERMKSTAATLLEAQEAQSAAAAADLAILQAELTHLQTNAIGAKDAFDQAMQSAQTMSALNDQMQETLTLANNEIAALTEKLQVKEGQLALSEAEVTRLAESLAAAEQRVESLKSQLEVTKTELADVKVQLNQATEEKSLGQVTSNARIAGLESQLSASANAHQQLAESIQSYQAQLAASHDAQNVLHASLRRSRQKVDDLRGSLEKRIEQLEGVVHQASALVEDKATLESSLAHASEAIETLERQVSKADRRVARLSNSNRQLNDERAEAMRGREEMRKQKEVVEAKVESVLGRYTDLKRKIAVVQGVMGQAVDAVNDLDKSLVRAFNW